MTRQMLNCCFCTLAIAAIVVIGAARVLGAPASRLLFPRVANGAPAPTICDGSAPILDQDTGSLSAIRDAEGRYIVAYQDRAHGGLAHVAQHVGATLAELSAPPIVLAVAPAFSPDGVKQGSLALVPGATPNDKSRLYYTQRKADDATGPYGIWCMEF